MTEPSVEDRGRGLMLGLLLGDAYDELDGVGPVRGTCLGQLACFTLEGMIRAHVRATHKGICHPPTAIWHAWCRWGFVQGINAKVLAEHWETGSEGWPDGWLCQVRPLGDRRGSAPATVDALRTSAVFPDRPIGGSAGHHAVTRTLPLALFVSATDASEVAGYARDLALATHGHPTARIAAARAVSQAADLLHGTIPPADESLLPITPGTAGNALAYGTKAAQERDLISALSSAAPHGRGATTVAAALFGAAHGVQALPGDLVGRLEIGWVADRLARDAFTEMTESPSSPYARNPDPTWWARYPGW